VLDVGEQLGVVCRVHRGKQKRISRAGAAVCNQKLFIVDDGSASPDD
jgi:hypothetical protein